MITKANLLAPFTKAASLITLISVVSLFVVFRLAGGLIYLTNSSSQESYQPDWSASEKKGPEEPRANSTNEGDGYLNDMLRRKEKANAESKSIGDAYEDRRASERAKTKEDSLDEIERNLGLK